MPTHTGLIAACTIVLATALALPSPAQAGWLEQGKSLLDGFGESSTQSPSALGTAEIAAGLREALQVGTERVVGRLGAPDGFNADPEVHIPLPATLSTVQSALQVVGASGLVDALELRLNRAAEQATPRAKQIFWDAIFDMSISDVEGIYNGPDDSATQYFRGKMTRPLAESMRPVVDDSLADVGAIQAYDRMMGEYRALPFVPDVKANLTTYVLERALEGIFLYLAQEEAAIRNNPLERSTDLLKRVFGAGG